MEVKEGRERGRACEQREGAVGDAARTKLFGLPKHATRQRMALSV